MLFRGKQKVFGDCWFMTNNRVLEVLLHSFKMSNITDYLVIYCNSKNVYYKNIKVRISPQQHRINRNNAIRRRARNCGQKKSHQNWMMAVLSHAEEPPTWTKQKKKAFKMCVPKRSLVENKPKSRDGRSWMWEWKSTRDGQENNWRSMEQLHPPLFSERLSCEGSSL